MKIYKILYTAVLGLILFGCTDVLDLKPTDKLSGEDLFSDPEGVKLYMANLYYQLPVEDFTYFHRNKNGGTFNYNGGGPNNGGFVQAMHTDIAMHSEFGEGVSSNNWGSWWDEGYKLIRDVNTLIKVIPELDINDQDRALLIGETSFIRAYAYFALAKRYGGVPLILEAQEYTTDVESLQVPRNTEEETWNFVLAECQLAADNLLEGDGSHRRATKWAALGLKSRAALHAASIAKFWDKNPVTGEAVDKGLVGMNASLANTYYQKCIEASEAIINSPTFELFRPNPSSPEEAAENYRQLFENPNGAPQEAIFIKGSAIIGNNHTANNYEIWFNPNQLANGWPHPGRYNPTLEWADLFESYSNPGVSTKLSTVVDGNEDYEGYDETREYIKYDTPHDVYKGKDARLGGTAILPGTMWKNTEIVIQAGFIKPDGSTKFLQGGSTTVNGTKYYTYGSSSASGHSGFNPAGGNHTRTGIGFKKFLIEPVDVSPAWNQGTLDFMDIRYAEILLNYAEAVIESGSGDQAKARTALNDIRKRAGHTTDIELTIENVMRERTVELCFENKRFYDLIRRRDFHEAFNVRDRHALLPILDLREDPPKYIMVRDVVPRSDPKTFNPKHYYKPIPGIGSNGLINNPLY